MKLPSFFNAKIMAPTSSESLKARWLSPEFSELTSAIRTAIRSGNELPEDIPLIDASWLGKTLKLADLRGIDLSGLTIGELDLTYCCFDEANFTETEFIGTYIQYSSFSNARLDKTTWESVQASPVDALGASFFRAFINNTFLMGSNLDGAKFEHAIIKKTALTGSNLKNSTIGKSKQLSEIDITQVILDDTAEVKKALASNNIKGLPYGINLVPNLHKHPLERNKIKHGKTLPPPSSFLIKEYLVKIKIATETLNNYRKIIGDFCHNSQKHPVTVVGEVKDQNAVFAVGFSLPQRPCKHMISLDGTLGYNIGDILEVTPPAGKFIHWKGGCFNHDPIFHPSQKGHENWWSFLHPYLSQENINQNKKTAIENKKKLIANKK